MILSIRKLLAIAGAAIGLGMPMASQGEDVDLFRGANGSGAINVLFVVDNSSNWSAANQNWPSVNTGRATALPCGSSCDKQGMAELAALYDVIDTMAVNESVSIGLMLFNNSNATRDGGYARVHVAPFSANQKLKLKNTLLAIITNFNGETAGSSVQYGAILWDAFKYFGGYSNPEDSTSRYPASGVSNPPYSTVPVFDTEFWGSKNVDPADGDAYTGQRYNPIINADNACGTNYIVFVGNGFPAKDDPSSSDMSYVLRLLNDPASPSNPKAIAQEKMPPYLTTNADANTVAAACTATCSPSNMTATQIAAAYNHVCKIGHPLGDANNNPNGVLDCREPINFTCHKSNCGGSNLRYGVIGFPAVNPTWVSPTGNDVRFADEFTKFLANTDVSAETGFQSVTTFTVDVFRAEPSVQQTQLMRSMAFHGNGEYYSASDSGQLKEAFASILRKVEAKNSVFASASLPVSATNRSQNENQVYIGVFRPDRDLLPRWFGNLKRYQITDFGEEVGLDLGDRYSRRAINMVTGFIDDCAVSFWTVDQGQYWEGVEIKPPGQAINPSPKTTCEEKVNQIAVTKGSLSDWPDGPSVEKGAASQMVRLGNNPDATTPTYAVDGSASGGTHGRKVYTLSSGAGMIQLDPATASSNVKYLMGFDLNNERPGSVADGTDNTLDVRPSVHGDVIHSRPIPVNYATATVENATPAPDIVIYYGSNDGLFRAVEASSGKELWAFMAPEFADRSSAGRLRTNSPVIQYPGVDYGTMEKKPKDYFFDGSSSVYQTANNSAIWLYTSQRRGGRMVYAFDITSKTAPAFKWRYGCPNLDNDTGCVGGDSAALMGQSWSLPSAIRIKLADGTSKRIVMFGGGYQGGYDASGVALCDDRDNIDPGCDSSSIGRGVHALDADTGEFLKLFPTTGPVAADIAFVDLDYDGYVDYAYAADTRGNLYRITLNANQSSALTESSIVKVAYTNAVSTNKGRKFLFSAAVLPYKTTVYLAIGSGDREHPLRTSYPYQDQVKNYFFVFRDDLTVTVPNGGYNMDSSEVMAQYTSLGGSTCETDRASVTPGAAYKGWSLSLSDLPATSTDPGPHRGEQTVSSALIAAGNVYFSTNSPDSSSSVCVSPLGIARGYALNLLTGCGYSSRFVGGGLPPSPVVATIPYTAKGGGDRVGTVCIGCAKKGVTNSSPIGGTQVKPTISQRRTKAYWYSNAQK